MTAAAAAVVFALVAALPLSLALVRSRALPPVGPVARRSFVFVFLGGQVVGGAVSLSLALPLSLALSVHFDGRAGARP